MLLCARIICTATKNIPLSYNILVLFCAVRDTRQHKEHTWQRHSVAPHLIFSRIGMRVLQPFDNLVPGTCLFGSSHHPAVCLEHIHPEPDFLIGRLRRFQVGSPPVRESLEPCAFRRGQPAYRIVHVYQRRILVIRGHQ